MSKDKIEVNMNVYDIPIVIEELEKAEKEIKQLQQENQQLKKQKDLVVEALKTLKYRLLYEEDFYVEDDGIDDMLRMLGEEDDNNIK